MAAQRLTNRTEALSTLDQERAVVYITVDWSIQERHSRKVFATFVERVETAHAQLGVPFWVLGEECDGIAEWFGALQLPGRSSTGYGAVVWLERGKAVDLVAYAAHEGVEELLKRTLRQWEGP